MVRLSPLVNSLGASLALGAAGGLTMLLASLRALLESDIKKVVALSTLRQLGVIILRLRMGAKSIAFFHLVVHAFFKALLFVCTGGLIHNFNDYQDLRRVGGALPALPLLKAVVVITKLSLCGVPFFSAFFSKELILENLGLSEGGSSGVYFLMWRGVALTAAYSARFIYFVLYASRARAVS